MSYGAGFVVGLGGAVLTGGALYQLGRRDDPKEQWMSVTTTADKVALAPLAGGLALGSYAFVGTQLLKRPQPFTQGVAAGMVIPLGTALVAGVIAGAALGIVGDLDRLFSNCPPTTGPSHREQESPRARPERF
jgi:hypothetical protein